MEEWERRKEEGELGTEQEQEEENIYAVSKDQEVRKLMDCMRETKLQLNLIKCS